MYLTDVFDIDTKFGCLMINFGNDKVASRVKLSPYTPAPHTMATFAAANVFVRVVFQF